MLSGESFALECSTDDHVATLKQMIKEQNADAPSIRDQQLFLQDVPDGQNRDAAFGMLNWYRASQMVVPTMDEPFELPADYSPPDLPDLTIPTLVIWALDDLALPPENLEGLDELVRPLSVVRVPDCGHFVPWEAHEAVTAAMEAFLEG